MFKVIVWIHLPPICNLHSYCKISAALFSSRGLNTSGSRWLASLCGVAHSIFGVLRLLESSLDIWGESCLLKAPHTLCFFPPPSLQLSCGLTSYNQFSETGPQFIRWHCSSHLFFLVLFLLLLLFPIPLFHPTAILLLATAPFFEYSVYKGL